MNERHGNRRAFLRASGALGVTSLAGCLFLEGSTDPSMGPFQDVEGLEPMFKGAPAMGNYPAEPDHVEMTMPSGMEMSMDAVTIEMIAPTDGTNNYHFMPHVAWVEPGQTVFWQHFAREGVSEPQPHTVTSFGAGGQFPRLVPEAADDFDSGYRAGTHSAGGHADDSGDGAGDGGDDHDGGDGGDDHDGGGGEETPHPRGELDRRYHIDERFNRGMVERIGQEGGMGVTFEEEGVYLYYCQNHHMFKMAGAVVVGPLYGEHGNAHDSIDEESPHGWAPAMTTEHVGEKIQAADPNHGEALAEQVDELRSFVHGGGEMGDDHGGDDH